MFYKKPFIVSGIIFLASLLMIYFGWTLAEKTNESNYFAMFAGGIFFAIIALVTFFVYLALEMKLKKMLYGQGVLLRYSLGPELLAEAVKQKGEEIKGVNKGILITIIAFCALIAIFAPLIVDGDDEERMLFRFICIGIGVFMTLMYLIITIYRVQKLKHADGKIVLSISAALAFGEFHCWDLPMYSLSSSSLYESGSYEGLSSAVLKLVYSTITRTGPTYYDILIPVPGEQLNNAISANIALNNLLS
ncbi:MAG: hypothetical protein WCQ41_05185 [Bacillota bacterium]